MGLNAHAMRFGSNANFITVDRLDGNYSYVLVAPKFVVDDPTRLPGPGDIDVPKWNVGVDFVEISGTTLATRI